MKKLSKLDCVGGQNKNPNIGRHRLRLHHALLGLMRKLSKKTTVWIILFTPQGS